MFRNLTNSRICNKSIWNAKYKNVCCIRLWPLGPDNICMCVFIRTSVDKIIHQPPNFFCVSIPSVLTILFLFSARELHIQNITISQRKMVGTSYATSKMFPVVCKIFDKENVIYLIFWCGIIPLTPAHILRFLPFSISSSRTISHPDHPRDYRTPESDSVLDSGKEAHHTSAKPNSF